MSEEHLPPLASWGQLSDPPKRKRTPSQYASQIADFKNVTTTISRMSHSTPNETGPSGSQNQSKSHKTTAKLALPNHYAAHSPTERPTILPYSHPASRRLPINLNGASYGGWIAWRATRSVSRKSNRAYAY